MSFDDWIKDQFGDPRQFYAGDLDSLREAWEASMKSERDRCGQIADSHIVSDPCNETVAYSNHIVRCIVGKIYGEPRR